MRPLRSVVGVGAVHVDIFGLGSIDVTYPQEGALFDPKYNGTWVVKEGVSDVTGEPINGTVYFDRKGLRRRFVASAGFNQKITFHRFGEPAGMVQHKP